MSKDQTCKGEVVKIIQDSNLVKKVLKKMW